MLGAASNFCWSQTAALQQAKAMTEALYARAIPPALLHTADIAAEYEALNTQGVISKGAPAPMGLSSMPISTTSAAI
jgi:hypothetical protein